MAFFQAAHVWIKDLPDGVAALILDRHGLPANFLDPAMLDELERAIDALAQANRHRLLIVRSAKAANFCHGPSTGLLASWSKADFSTWAERGQRVCEKIAALPMPSVCIISGSCFDAGLELALASDYRVVLDRPETLLGLPEIEWGMVPCWGATQRLPHLIGLDNSLRMLLAGQRVPAKTAWQIGLADELSTDDEDSPPALLANPGKRDWSAFPRRSWRERWLESNRPGRWFLFRGAERILRTRLPDEMPAQAELLGGLRQAFQGDWQAGLAYERQALDRIAIHPALGNMLRLLEHREQLRAQSLSANNRDRRIGVIGEGTAALSLLLHSVTKGYEMVVRSGDEDALGTALSRVIQLLHAEVQRGGMTQEQFQNNLGAIRGTYTWTHFDSVDLVLDTEPGRLEGKQAFYAEIERHVADEAVIVPISPIAPIAQLQQGMRHPERLVGVHLMEPWNRGSLLEIVTAAASRPGHLQRVRAWAVSLGKCCLQVPDQVGGLATRIWLPALNEAGLLVKEGIPIDRIDQAMRRFGMTLGPCEWMDRLGTERVAGWVAALQPIFAGRIQLETGFAAMAEKQLLGNQTGSGFYRSGFRNRKPNAETAALWRASQGEVPRPTPVLSEADSHAWIQGRLATLIVLEGVRCLEEGLAASADDLDCAICLTGWPTHRGGPIGFARQLGMDTLIARCTELEREHGPRFAPLPALRKCLEVG